MNIKWKCPNCGALHTSQEALTLLLSKTFIPMNVEETARLEPRKMIPREEKPASKPKPEPKYEDMEDEKEEIEDLRLDQ